MEKSFLVTITASVIPDHALGEHEVADAINKLVFQTESKFGMGSLGVDVLELDETQVEAAYKA